MWRATGTNGTITFDGRTVTIERTGAAARVLAGKGSKSIPITSIAGIEWKPAGLTAGQISFNTGGRDEAPMMRMGRNAKAAMSDANTVAFHRNRQRDFEQVRDAIQHAMANPAPVPAAPPQGPPAGWYTDPRGTASNRWWDGTQWTEHTQPA